MKTVAQYVGTAMDCSACGRRHQVGVREVRLAPTAIGDLPDLIVRLGLDRQAIVVHDARTRAVAGTAVLNAFASADVEATEVLIPDPVGGGDPICDDLTRDALRPRLPAKGLLVAVGAGVVNDLVKWIAADAGRPYVVVPTAASMNGYTSANIAPTVKGVKCLLHGREAVAVVTTPQILQAAPAEMTAAGLGDVLAKPVSTADWMLNRILFNEYYCPVCADLIRDIEPAYMAAPEQIAARTTAGIAALFEAIILTGFSMTMAGTSSPASGGEHLISHTLDMMAARDGSHHDLHGRQVGVATIFCAALYEELFGHTPRTIRSGVTRTDPAFWQRFADVVEEKHALKRQRQEQAAHLLRQTPGRWEELRSALSVLYRPPQLIKEVLRRAGAAHRLADIGVSREHFIAAVLHAHEVRERYTVLELARSAGILPEAAGDLVDRWLVT
jgi:glycerol-1-phosphate dehydrogenase [NAD(P)+]